MNRVSNRPFRAEFRMVRFNYNKTKVRAAAEENKSRKALMIPLISCPGTSVLKTPEIMLQHIAHALNMSPECFQQRTRQRAVSELRFVGAYLLRMHFPELRLQQIAILFGGQDHTSILNGISRANDLIYSGNAQFIEKYETASRSVDVWLQKDATNYGLAATA